MEKTSLKIKKYINPHIEVGDKIKLIDGSALSHIKLKGDFYIIYSYPEITGTDALLKDIVGEVVETNIKNRGCFGDFHIYVQDIVISLGKTKFRTCSKFVKVVDEDNNFIKDLYFGRPRDLDKLLDAFEQVYGRK